MSRSYGFKVQLKDVLSDAVSNFQDCGDPNAACIKAANSAEFNEDQADRLVEAFNTARVICHYKAAEDKASACSLADKDIVRRGLGSREQRTKVASTAFVDYSFYDTPEPDYVVPEVKAASAALVEEAPDKSLTEWLAFRGAETLRQCIKSAEEEARGAEAMANEIAEKVAYSLSRNVSIDAVHDKVARIIAAYANDERYSPGVEKVAALLPSASDPDPATLRKYASRHVVATEDLAGVMSAIKEAADFTAEAAALEAYAVEMRKQAEGGFFTLMTDYIPDAYKRKRDKDISDASSSVVNLRKQLLPQDLLVRDKVLSQEDPTAVLTAFQAINQASPDSALNKEMMRSMLRSAVQSVALSPFDVKTLSDIDNSRREAYAVGGASKRNTSKERKQ